MRQEHPTSQITSERRPYFEDLRRIAPLFLAMLQPLDEVAPEFLDGTEGGTILTDPLLALYATRPRAFMQHDPTLPMPSVMDRVRIVGRLNASRIAHKKRRPWAEQYRTPHGDMVAVWPLIKDAMLYLMPCVSFGPDFDRHLDEEGAFDVQQIHIYLATVACLSIAVTRRSA